MRMDKEHLPSSGDARRTHTRLPDPIPGPAARPDPQNPATIERGEGEEALSPGVMFQAQIHFERMCDWQLPGESKALLLTPK